MQANNARRQLSFISTAKKPLCCYIVYFELESRIKNNFSVGPMKTDSGGMVVVSLEGIKQKIKETVDAFPMDYGSIETLSGRARPILYSRDSLKEIQENRKLWESVSKSKAEAIDETVQNAPAYDIVGSWLDWTKFLAGNETSATDVVEAHT